MPLIKGKSEKAFKQNVRTEMHAGKPQKQSLAIAYAMKRKAQKMAKGGMMQGSGHDRSYSDGGSVFDPAKLASAQNSMRKAFHYADGGQIKDNYQDANPNWHQTDDEGVDEYASGFVDHQGDVVKHNKMATSEDDRLLNQHGKEEQGPYGVMMADGGFIGSHQSEDHEMDMVGRIMKQRQMHYSKGGKVANATPITAGFKPNEFDDLVLRDDLESSYGDDDNSGDALGDAGEDARRSDIIARIMASRKKKDKNPRPA